MSIPLPQTCIGCPLFMLGGTGFTLVEGDGSIPLCVVSEAPGEHEADEGLPLRWSGAAGSVFRRALRELGIPAHRITITNILRSRPPGNELRGAPYEREAIDHCSQYLNATIRERRPTVILALGDVPLRELAAEHYGTVTVVRGFLLDSKWPGTKLVSTYHPAFIARGQWQLFGAFKRDIALAFNTARNGPPALVPTNYLLHPTLADVRAYLNQCRTGAFSHISYDVETASILGVDEPDDWRHKHIIQVQFSSAPGHAIVMPWEGEYRELAKAVLATDPPKWSWNGRCADELVLKADGCVLGGEQIDLMNAWGHINPSFWGGKDDRDTDKGVPSRLMGLQSCASFYCPEIRPWKGAVERAIATATSPDEVQQVLREYGARDGDITTRVGIGIFNSIEAQGLMGGYRSHKVDLRPVLDLLGATGLPVDRTKQVELRAYVNEELTTLQTRMQELVPRSLLSVHPKAGYKALHSKVALVEQGGEKVALKVILADYDPSQPPLVTAAGHTGYLVGRQFELETDEGEAYSEGRWCIERLYNPHGSSPNTKAYIRHRGYRMPTAIDTGLETTGKLELQRLAEETDDEVLRLTGEWREMAKVGRDYTGGFWIPGADGRVHATFRWGTASAQLVAIEPPVMTFPEHSGIAKMAKAAICAQDGHTLVKIDAAGFHAKMAGWLARDPVYYRIADFDPHSFVVAHFLHLHDAPYLLDMADDELRVALADIKRQHNYIRNYKVKRVVHGVTFGMRARKLYRMYSQNFENEREAQHLIDLLGELFPRTFIIFPQWVENQIRHVTRCRLVSPFGHHRTFYDFDIQQATAFLPSNCSHCHIQAALVRMYRNGALQRYEAVNFTHDAVWLHPRTELVNQCIVDVKAEIEAPSTVLVDNPLGPFSVRADAEVGMDLAHMDAA